MSVSRSAGRTKCFRMVSVLAPMAEAHTDLDPVFRHDVAHDPGHAHQREQQRRHREQPKY